jgi:hypothetical protein
MGGPIGTGPARVRQGVRISAVGLHPTRPPSVHRRVIRVSHDDLVAKVFEAAGDPLTLRRRLHEDPGLWSTAEHLDQARAPRPNAPVDQLTVLREDRNLAVPLPEVDANMVHG